MHADSGSPADDDSLDDASKPWIKLEQYGGGPDESYVTGNFQGYRALCQRLQDALERHRPNNAALDLTLDDIIDSNSDIQFDYFEVRNSAKPKGSGRSDLAGRFVGAGCLLVSVIVFLFGLVGLVAFITSLFGA